MFDNFDEGDIESYKNFEFGKNKFNAREQSIYKPVASQLPPALNDFSLKGLKMNVKKKR